MYKDIIKNIIKKCKDSEFNNKDEKFFKFEFEDEVIYVSEFEFNMIDEYFYKYSEF